MLDVIVTYCGWWVQGKQKQWRRQGQKVSTQDFGKVPYLSHSAGGVGFGWMASGLVSTDGLDMGGSCGEAARRVEGQGEGCRFVSKKRRWRGERIGLMVDNVE